VIFLTEADRRIPQSPHDAPVCVAFCGAAHDEDRTMMGAFRKACLVAALLPAVAIASTPARAQFAPFGGAGGDMMTQMAPMLEMMKARMGKRRFAALMQTMGPMMSKMMEGGGSFGGMPGIGGIPGGFGGGSGFIPDGLGTAAGGDITGMLGGDGGQMMSMIPQIMQLAGGGFGGGHGRRHHRHRP
jgi:hypothetical protein